MQVLTSAPLFDRHVHRFGPVVSSGDAWRAGAAVRALPSQRTGFSPVVPPPWSQVGHTGSTQRTESSGHPRSSPGVVVSGPGTLAPTSNLQPPICTFLSICLIHTYCIVYRGTSVIAEIGDVYLRLLYSHYKLVLVGYIASYRIYAYIRRSIIFALYIHIRYVAYRGRNLRMQRYDEYY